MKMVDDITIEGNEGTEELKEEDVGIAGGPKPIKMFDHSHELTEEAYASTVKSLNDGEVLEGQVVRIDKDEVLIDVGYKSEGVIPVKELSIRHNARPEDVVEIGQEIEAIVLQKEDKEGRLLMSRKRAIYEKSWGRLEEHRREGTPVEGEVIDVVKGGLILDIGLRGFLPASLVETKRVKELTPYIGMKLQCKILEMDRNRNNVVLSRRAFLEESENERKKQLLDTLEKGQIVQGKVSSIVGFGAFVDIGGVDGLIHISELSWSHVEKPSDVVQVGDDVEVEIKEINKEAGRISLSLKATQMDPWSKLAREISSGDVIEGVVTNIVSFGAFVEVAENIEGLVHISELSLQHVVTPTDVVSMGDKVNVKVKEIDTEKRRLSLSIKEVERDTAKEEEDSVDGEFAESEKSGNALGEEKDFSENDIEFTED